jgi:hypothetical protein
MQGTPPTGKSGPAHKSNLIFVFAGRERRKLYALQLFQEGRAAALLLSVGRYEIRRFSQLPLPRPVDLLSLAAPIDPPLRHFFVTFTAEDVVAERVELARFRRFGTMSEVQALRVWLGRHPEVREILVISDRSHRARADLCCRKLLPHGIQFAFLAVPDAIALAVEQSRQQREGRVRYWFSEVAKLVVYWFVFAWRDFIKHAEK